jgi:hypothetical protein
VNIELKQGCLLSTSLFNLYINDLSELLNNSGVGIELDEKLVNHLFYADDLILLAKNEEHLQLLIVILSQWCTINNITLNTNKTKILHFRTSKTSPTEFVFKCNQAIIERVSQYSYLGLVLTDTLDYSITAKHVAQSASRALGLLISKYKALGGMDYEVCTKLYDTMVWPTISYGAAIWGIQEFTCINAVHHKACRFFLGVGRYTPNTAVTGDMGWTPPHIRQWKSVLGQWFRLNRMDDNRLNKQCFDYLTRQGARRKNWSKTIILSVNTKLQNAALSHGHTYSKAQQTSIINSYQQAMLNEFKLKWEVTVNREHGQIRANGGNKLQNYRQFMTEFTVEPYVK